MAQDGDAVRGAASIDVSRHRFTLDLEWFEPDQLVPPIVHVIVQRVGDPAWCYRPSSSEWEKTEQRPPGHRLFEFEGLGAGTYQLKVNGATVEPKSEPLLRITLPGPQVVKIRCEIP